MNEYETMKYFMAAEKVGNLLHCMGMTIEFIEEFKIKPDDEVRKAVIPLLENLTKWLKN